jgi:hypothetical protein
MGTQLYYTVPAFADLDGDGAVDLAVGFSKSGTGGSIGKVYYYINEFVPTNTPQLRFQEKSDTDDANPFKGVDVGNRAVSDPHS